MAGINKVIIVGRLGSDPEVRYFQDGTAVANFSVATSEEWKDKNTGEKKERTEWHRIVAYRRLGEICGQYLSKGRQVYIEGRIQSRSYDDRDGIKRNISEIIATTVQFLGGRDDAAPKENNSYAKNNYQPQNTQTSPGQMNGSQGSMGMGQQENGYQQGNMSPPPPPEDDIPF